VQTTATGTVLPAEQGCPNAREILHSWIQLIPAQYMAGCAAGLPARRTRADGAV